MRLPWFLVDPDTPGTQDDHVPDAPDVPVPLKVAAVVVVVQGLFAVVFGAAEAFNFTSARAVMGATTALFFIAFGAGMLLCAWGLVRLHSWARGPVLLAQLMSLGLAWNFRGEETEWISVVLAVPAVIGLVGMLHPKTVAALVD